MPQSWQGVAVFQAKAMLDPPEPQPAGSRAPWALPSGIVVLGLALRLYHLNYASVWGDEIFTLSVSRQPLREMYPAVVTDFVHPPLHYFLLHFWFKLVGFGPFQARFLSVVFGTLAIIAVYLLGEYLFDRRAASLAALLLAVSQLGVMYSQEARPYALLLFLVPCCSYLFLVALRTGDAGPWWGFVLTAILVAYTNYFGFFAVAALLLFAAVYRVRYPIPISRWIGGTALGLLLYLPWLTSGFVGRWIHAHQNVRGLPRAYMPWWTVLSTINTFNNGRTGGLIESSPWWTFLLGGLLFSIPALITFEPLLKKSLTDSAERQLRENVLFLILLFGIPFSAVLGVCFLSASYFVRYIMFVISSYYLLVGRGISAFNRTALRAALLSACLAYSVYSLRVNYFVPYKEDYKGAYAHLAQAGQPGDCYVVVPPSREEKLLAQWAWAIYEGSRPAMTPTSLEGATSGQATCARVWLISIERRSFPSAVKLSEGAQHVLELDHVRIEESRYFCIVLDLFVPRGQ